jgi:hypothetical protein
MSFQPKLPLDARQIELLRDQEFRNIVAEIGSDALAEADSPAATLEVVRGQLARWATHLPAVDDIVALHTLTTIALVRFRVVVATPKTAAGTEHGVIN